MRPVQTRENGPRDSWILGTVGIDNVSELWQNLAKVHGPFAKTSTFQRNDLAIAVKTKLAPPDGNPTRPTTERKELADGLR